MKRKLIICFGILLFVLSVYGITYAGRVTYAQNMYFRAKSAVSLEESENMLKFYESALKYYDNNYYFCILAAENAYYSSFQMAAENAHKSIIRAQQWCDAGLKLNPYRVQLRRLKTCLIALNSPMDAVLYWEKYVDWQYWEPAHHALLIELYALTGQYEKAVGSLSLIKDTPYYVEAAKKLDDAWRKEKTLPRELSEKLSKDNH